MTGAWGWVPRKERVARSAVSGGQVLGGGRGAKLINKYQLPVCLAIALPILTLSFYRGLRYRHLFNVYY